MTNIFRICLGKWKEQGEPLFPKAERGRRKDVFRARRLFFFAFAILLMIGPVPAPSHAHEAASQPQRAEAQPGIAAANPGGQGAAAESRRNPGVLRSSLLNISLRGRFSGLDVLGGTATEEFQEFDAAAQFRLPWGWYSQSGWGGGLRLMASAGVL